MSENRAVVRIEASVVVRVAARRWLTLVGTVVVATLLGACGDGDAAEPGPTPTTAAASVVDPTPEPDPPAEPTPADESDEAADELFPDVLAAEATETEPGVWSVSVTLSSPYDTPERYADAWRILGPDGAELGVRVLTHDHANEQPFTRSLSGVAIPDEVTRVTIQGRDQVSGWGGATVELELPR